MNRTSVRFKKNHPDAIIPKGAYTHPSGMDLSCINDVIIPPRSTVVVDTGLSCEIPSGYEMQIRPRSGLAVQGITIVNSPGTIDSDYRGPIKVILHNLSPTNINFLMGDRIAQAVIMQLPVVDIIEVEELSQTERGEKGFGSSGT